jgi:hypothetical protein
MPIAQPRLLCVYFCVLLLCVLLSAYHALHRKSWIVTFYFFLQVTQICKSQQISFTKLPDKDFTVTLNFNIPKINRGHLLAMGKVFIKFQKLRLIPSQINEFSKGVPLSQ